MKFFQKKTVRSPESRSEKTEGDSTHSFYSRYAGEAPLDEYSDVSGPQTLRTSRHGAARRREVSNRASNWTIALLLLRAVLLVLLLVGGFIVLKLVLDRMSEPTEKDQQRWENTAAQMEKSSVPEEAPVSQELAVSATEMEAHLKQWNQTEQLLRSAEALNLRGINEEAAQRLTQALRITPDNRKAQQMLADIYMQLGRAAEAVPLYIHLLDLGGPLPERQMNLLLALQESGQIAAGLALANQMLLDQPNNEVVLSFAAAGQLQLGKPDAALPMFEKILESNATNTVALKNCGQIYFDRGDYEKAVSYYTTLIKIEPKPEYYQMLARSYAHQNQAGKAVVCMGQAASLFGGGTVSPWLKEVTFDPIRESVEFRSFADRLVGVETRKAIEAINKREAEKATPAMPGGLELPKQPDLNVIRPDK